MGGVSRTGADGLTRRGEQGSPHGHATGASLTSRPPAARPARSAAVSPHRCAAILSTLKEISTATPDVEGCRRLLECISNELQAEQGVLILCNSLTRELEFVVHNQDPATPRMYAEYYGTLDPTGLGEYIKGNVAAPLAAGPFPASLPVCAAFDLSEVVDYSSLVSTEFYNDFFKTSHIHYDLAAIVSASSSVRGAVCVHRDHQRKPFTAEEVAILDMIAPFVGNHLERMASASILSVFQTGSDKGVILCDTHGRVIYCNEAARVLCSSFIRLDGVPRLVQDASFVGYELDDLETVAARRDLKVVSRDVVLDQGTPGRLITLEHRSASTPDFTQVLQERFGLTDREIEVLGKVMAGGGNREIAQALFIAEVTVKKHLQNISVKVGARTRTGIAHAVRQELGLQL
jgi:DNA-binding CsgD family transcriptional regulator